MRIDYVSNDDDWVELFVDGKLWWAGHEVPTYIWMSLLLEVNKHGEIYEWTYNFDDFGVRNDSFSDLYEEGLKRVE